MECPPIGRGVANTNQKSAFSCQNYELFSKAINEGFECLPKSKTYLGNSTTFLYISLWNDFMSLINLVLNVPQVLNIDFIFT